jgi:hypothetical protein
MWVWQHRKLASNNAQWTNNHQVVEVVVAKRQPQVALSAYGAGGGQRISELAVVEVNGFPNWQFGIQ